MAFEELVFDRLSGQIGTTDRRSHRIKAPGFSRELWKPGTSGYVSKSSLFEQVISMVRASVTDPAGSDVWWGCRVSC